MSDQLTTLANVKDWLEITNGTSDATLTRLVLSVSAMILNWLNRDAVLTGTFTDRLDGSGSDTLVVPHYPITSITSLVIQGASPTPASPDGVQPGYVFKGRTIQIMGGFSIPLAGSPGYWFPKGAQNVTLVSVAGHNGVPPDMEQACISWVAELFRGRSRAGLKSEALQGQTTSYAREDIPPHVAGMLQQFKSNIPL